MHLHRMYCAHRLHRGACAIGCGRHCRCSHASAMALGTPCVVHVHQGRARSLPCMLLLYVSLQREQEGGELSR
jgi:hypothetical protein